MPRKTRRKKGGSSVENSKKRPRKNVTFKDDVHEQKAASSPEQVSEHGPFVRSYLQDFSLPHQPNIFNFGSNNIIPKNNNTNKRNANANTNANANNNNNNNTTANANANTNISSLPYILNICMSINGAKKKIDYFPEMSLPITSIKQIPIDVTKEIKKLGTTNYKEQLKIIFDKKYQELQNTPNEIFLNQQILQLQTFIQKYKLDKSLAQDNNKQIVLQSTIDKLIKEKGNIEQEIINLKKKNTHNEIYKTLFKQHVQLILDTIFKEGEIIMIDRKKYFILFYVFDELKSSVVSVDTFCSNTTGMKPFMMEYKRNKKLFTIDDTKNKYLKDANVEYNQLFFFPPPPIKGGSNQTNNIFNPSQNDQQTQQQEQIQPPEQQQTQLLPRQQPQQVLMSIYKKEKLKKKEAEKKEKEKKEKEKKEKEKKEKEEEERKQENMFLSPSKFQIEIELYLASDEDVSNNNFYCILRKEKILYNLKKIFSDF
jgi:hypothetical protein